jgi:hypothetical protein
MSPQSLESVRAEALFASHVQYIEGRSAELVRAAVMGSVRRYGSRGCAELVAQEFGEHPDAAAARMSWVLDTVRRVYSVPAPRRYAATIAA